MVVKAPQVEHRMARQSENTGRMPRAIPCLGLRSSERPFERAVDDRLRCHEGPTIRIKLVWESEFRSRKTMGEAMDPDLSVSGFGVEPHASFG